MKYASFRGRKDKSAKIARLFSDYLRGDVLDVGCDAKYLSDIIQGKYVGVDLSGSPDIRVNVEGGLLLRIIHSIPLWLLTSWSIATGFISYLMSYAGVSRSYLIIGLPNMYEWHFRLMFLLGNDLSGKYRLNSEPPTDRHRWLLNLNDARAFLRQRAVGHGFSVAEEALGYYAYRRFVPKLVTRIGRLLAPRSASLFAYHYWAVLRRDDGTLQAG